MKRAISGTGIIALCVLFIACGGPTPVKQKPESRGGLTKISDNVYSYVGTKNATPQKSYGANAGIIIGKDGIVVIDTLTSSKEAKGFINDIRAISDKPIKYVVNTHFHFDHTFGDSEFARLGAVIISHAECRKSMEKSGESVLKSAGNYGLTEEDIKGTEISYPTVTFQERVEIDPGDQKIELIYPGPSHTAGSVLVYLPEEKILFSGDILFTDYHPYVVDGNIEKWVKVLDRIAMMDVETIIPGHGPLSTKKDLADMKSYLITLDRKSTRLNSSHTDISRMPSSA